MNTDRPEDTLDETQAAAADPDVDETDPPIEQRQGVDPIELATDLLTEAAGALLQKPPAGQRLEHKIALGQAIATLVQAQATRQLAMLTQQQLQLVVHAQQVQQQVREHAKGPTGIVVPQASGIRL